MPNYSYTHVFTIAGSDSGGAAGIQADLKTFAALGCYGTSAITAVTAQNTLGVTALHPVPPDVIAAQIKAVMDDIKPTAIKIGMLPNLESVEVVAKTLRDYRNIPIIVDPVMISSTGASLTTATAISAMCKELFPIASLLTPNRLEAAVFTGIAINNIEEMKIAAHQLLKHGSYAVLVKGGHLHESNIIHQYADCDNVQFEIQSSYIRSNNTHGTGCTLSAAICAYIAKGETMKAAIQLAEKFVNKAIKEGRTVKTGKGNGPLNHFFQPQPSLRTKI